MNKRSEKLCLAQSRKGRQVGKIRDASLDTWRPFGFAQSELGAIKFLEVALSSILIGNKLAEVEC
jgi:hypothetical protein